MPRATEDRLGAVGIEFLNDVTTLSPGDRPTAASCLGKPFVDIGPLRCLGDGGIFPGMRHAWRVVKGYMEPEILSWLRAEAADQLEAWKRKAQDTEALRQGKKSATKYILSGKVSDQCFSKSLNARDVKDTLPAPRLCAFVRAFVKANEGAIIALAAKCQAKLEQLRAGGENIGANGRFVLEKSVYQWFLVAGEIHIIDSPAGVTERRHVDGAAGCYVMGITLFGRRDIRLWPRAKAEEEKEGVIDEPSHTVGLAPGSVYIGTFTGPEHQAAHTAVQDSLQGGHSVTLILRTSLFPYDKSRGMKQVATPAAVLYALVAEFAAELGAAACWRLPTLEECLAQVRIE